MKKITTILMLLMLTCMGAWAAGESLTFSISKTTGTFTSGNGNNTWFNTWTSTDGTITLQRANGANDMQWDGDRFKMNANGALGYTITFPAQYTIDKVEATFYDGTARESYVTINGIQKKLNAGQTATLTFEGLSGNTLNMTLDHKANNTGNRLMRTDAFVITYHELGAVENVTFKVVNENNEVLAEQVVEKEVGSEITDLPAEMKRSFTTYTSTPITVTEGGENVFTATATFNTPFEISTDFDNAKWYYLNLKGGTGFPTYVADGNPNVTLPGSNAENDNTSWAFVGDTYNGFTIYNKAAGGSVVLGSALNVGSDGNTGGSTYATLNAPGTQANETWKIDASSHATNGFFMRNADGHALNHRSSANLAYWTGGDGTGSTFTVAKVPEREISYIQALDEMENGKVYAIYNSRGIWKFADNATSMSTENVPGDLDALCATPADAYQIGIVKQNDKYYLYNVAQKKYLAAGNKLYTSPLEAVTITQSTSGAATGNYKWFFSFDGSHNINVSQGNVLIDGWSTHDGGNVNAIMVTDATYTVEDAIAPFTDYTQCVTDYRDYKGIATDFVDNIGKLGYPKESAATTELTDILDRNASGENTADDFNNFMDKYNAAVAADNMKLPEVGMFLRLKGVAGGRYMQSTASTNATGGRQGLRLGATETADASTIFYLDTDNKLLGFTNGLYVTNTCDITSVESNLANATQFTFVFREMGKFAVKNGSTFLYSWDGTTNYCVDRQGSDHANCVIALEEVTELPITLRSTDGTNYFATFSAPVNVQISGASLNNVQKDGNTATFTTVNTNVLKAGVGVLLSGTSESATATIITEEVTDANYGLVGYYAATEGTGDETKYYLGKSKKNGQAGFYKLGSGTTSNGFKAYLENTTGEAKEGFDLEFAGVTGIDNMENGTLNMENGAVYNLQGQRVNKAQKGVFIQNGKKVVLK